MVTFGVVEQAIFHKLTQIIIESKLPMTSPEFDDPYMQWHELHTFPKEIDDLHTIMWDMNQGVVEITGPGVSLIIPLSDPNSLDKIESTILQIQR